MIKNRFLRFLVNIPVSLITFLIFGLIFQNFASMTAIGFGMLFAVAIWFIFTLQREIFYFPDAKFFQLLKNIVTIAMLALSAIALIASMLTYFNQGEEFGLFAPFIVVAPSITIVAALFLAGEDQDDFAKFIPYGVPAISVASLLISLLLSIVGIVEMIGVIVFCVAAVVFAVLAFKLGWISFSFSSGSYRYTPYTPPATTKKSFSTPDDAMQYIASKWSSSCQLTGNARFTYNLTYTISGGTVKFKINGNVFYSGVNITQSDVNEANNALERELKFIANNRIIPAYNEEVDALVSKGINCSSVAAVSVSVGNITVS